MVIDAVLLDNVVEPKLTTVPFVGFVSVNTTTPARFDPPPTVAVRVIGVPKVDVSDGAVDEVSATVVGIPTTVCENVAKLPEFAASPLYTANTVCVPRLNVDVVYEAVDLVAPTVSDTAAPTFTPSIEYCTVPEGDVPVTVATKVTDPPSAEGLPVVVRAVLVGSVGLGPTLTLVKAASPICDESVEETAIPTSAVAGIVSVSPAPTCVHVVPSKL